MTATAPTDGPLTSEELQLATRNRGMPLEGLRYDITPSGMHYLLVHFDIPALDPDRWSLSIDGNVDRPLTLTLGDLRARPARTLAVTMECAGNGRALLRPRPISQPWLVEAVGTAEWSGVPLADVLAEAGLRTNTAELVFSAADHGLQDAVEQDYARSLTVADATRPEVLLVYAMNGRPLEPQHGAPVRLLVPGWYGMASVKWLTRIEAVIEPFDGYQQRTAYHYQRDADDPGTPVSRMRVRTLMIPPGYPDFLTRQRFVDRGQVELHGRAWSGLAPVARVEIGVNEAWDDATLDDPIGEFAWRGWTWIWNAQPGDRRLACRATDALGNVQPLDQPWNYQGMGNNLAQTIVVTVR